jgi:hypothetical protein
MIALDGNAIAGDLLEAFGVDLTAATCVCAACGMSSVVGRRRGDRLHARPRARSALPRV